MDDAPTSLATTASEAMRLVAEGEKAVTAFKKKVPSYRRQLRDWSFYADKRQLPPAGDWHCWLMLAGRGFGKTRAGAEWVHSLVESEGAIRIPTSLTSISMRRNGLVVLCRTAKRSR